MSVGVGIGFIFLAREGLSYAMLKHMPGAEQADMGGPAEDEEEENAQVEEERRERARIAR
jgi:hypothetical protein